MIRIVNIADRDYGAGAHRLTEAINQYTEHEAKHIVMQAHQYGYPHGMVINEGHRIKHWVEWADIVNCFIGYKPLKAAGVRPQNLFITHVGSHYHHDPQAAHIAAKKWGVKRTISAHVQWMWFGGADTCIPVTVPVDRWAKLRKSHDGLPIVCQSPSQPQRKKTAMVVQQLQSRKDIVLRIIRGKSWHQCIELKRNVDIHIGGFKGHGLSSLEGWTMMAPVINNTLPEHEKSIVQHVGYLPYYKSTARDVSDAVDALLNPATYAEYAERGYQYVLDWHDYPVVASKFIALCEEVL